MKAFSLFFNSLSLPYADDIDTLLYQPINTKVLNKEVPTWQGLIYEYMVKSKELMNYIVDSTEPIVWLLPAWLYNPERIALLTASLQEQYNHFAQHLIFHGSSSVDSAIALAYENNWQHVNFIALDTTYRVDKNGQYLYQGIGGASATLSLSKVGWSQRYSELVPSIDFIKNNTLDGMLTRLAQTTEQPFDLIFTSSNGVQNENDAWLHSLQAISDKITDKTCYKFPQYTYGQIGALSGLINIYTLTTNPTIVEHNQCALIISQEIENHQAVASYLWVNEENVSNRKPNRKPNGKSHG